MFFIAIYIAIKGVKLNYPVPENYLVGSVLFPRAAVVNLFTDKAATTQAAAPRIPPEKEW